MEGVRAIIGFYGKQFIVSEKSKISVNKLDAKVGQKISPTNVYLGFDEDGKVSKTCKVYATVLAHFLGEKCVVHKKIRRHGYRRKVGHRHPQTYLQIDKIEK